MKTSWTVTMAAVAAFALGACGGDGFSVDEPTATTQTSIGTISGFGSVIVNGVRFDDTGAAVRMDDNLAAREQLRVGMVVQVRGRIRNDGTGVADSIRFDDCVQGPIAAMNQVQNTVTVLGQTVQVDEGTVLDGVALRDMNAFQVGDLVEVSCLPDPASQRLRATRMERQGAFQNGVSELELEGVVSELDAAASRLKVGGQLVDFAGVAAAERPAGLANGMNVEVRGNNLANGLLTADRLRDRDRDRIHFVDGEGLEIEGYISGFVSVASFNVGAQAVDASNAVFRNGTAADLADGVKVEVEGTIADGVLLARLVVIKRQPQVKLAAGLQLKDAAANTLVVLGRTIAVNVDTELRDRIESETHPAGIALDDLAVADRVEVEAFADATGQLVATRVERTEPDPLVVVKGPADLKLPTTRLTLAGVEVATGPATVYRDASGTAVDATTFYAAVQVPPAVPTTVHARGVVATLATSVVDATRSVATTGELEIEAP